MEPKLALESIFLTSEGFFSVPKNSLVSVRKTRVQVSAALR